MTDKSIASNDAGSDPLPPDFSEQNHSTRKESPPEKTPENRDTKPRLPERWVPQPAKRPLCIQPTGYIQSEQADQIADRLHSWALRVLAQESNAESQGIDSDAIVDSNNDLARIPDPSGLSENLKVTNAVRPRRFVDPETYRTGAPDYLEDLGRHPDTSEEYKYALNVVNALPSPPKLPSFLNKPILNTDPGILDDKSVLDMPNHTVLNHIATSSIKDNVLGISTTTRYIEKTTGTTISGHTQALRQVDRTVGETKVCWVGGTLSDNYPANSTPGKYTDQAISISTISKPTAMATATRFRLVFHAPTSAVTKCKEAIFGVGAGRYPGPGNYTECCWTTIGTGQFRPGDAAKPHLGEVGKLEEVEEARVETICVGEDVARNAVKALKSAHPYEEPSYSVYRLEDF
ncbi:structural toxin [Fusarium beomiforme]|uniref:ATP phosphoribosyltransferase n=1 Tax=Fusarium beomiforme TaxID=44412 RepID=A0A9P5AT11_9HYPO|nr:structural toxin [Fusarium beomiforme]